MKRLIFGGISLCAIFLVAAESSVRALGFVDFPLYDANNQIGYIPRANQSGSYMNQNNWAFNELSMGTALAFKPTPEKKDILLIGDSIVLGGNSYREDERLGPQLGRISGDAVWPISAGSWGLQNELEYLREHPEVVASVDQIIFVLNSGDFDRPSSWASEFTHPLERPSCALCYLVAKFVFRPIRSTPADLMVERFDAIVMLKAFAETYRKPFDIWLYPDKAQINHLDVWEKEFGPHIKSLEAAQIPGLTLHSGEGILGWQDMDYRDSIHPTPAATRKLAKAISDAL